MSAQSRSRLTIQDSLPAPRASRHEMSTTVGMLAARTWLGARGLSAPDMTRWHVHVLLDVIEQPAREAFDERTDTRFRIEIHSDEWGFYFCHAHQASYIRVVHAPMVHGRDDFALIGQTPPLKDLGVLVRSVEHRYKIRFRRRNAVVRTNLPSAEAAIRRWVEWL